MTVDRKIDGRDISGRDISSRDIAAGILGATVGAAVLWLASGAALNRGLVMAAMVTGGLTLWSAIDWRASSTGGPGSERGPASRRPDPADPITERITDPGTNHPEPQQPDVGPTTVANLDDRATGAVAGGGSGHVDTARFVQLDDLLNDRPVRELQCGSCASFEVGIVADRTAGDRSALACRACAATTELDRAGRPHPVRVRSNPERAATRKSSTNTATTQTKSITTKEQS